MVVGEEFVEYVDESEYGPEVDGAIHAVCEETPVWVTRYGKTRVYCDYCGAFVPGTELGNVH